MKDLTRRQIRYICFRLQNDAEGASVARPEKDGIMKHVNAVKRHMEEQDDFGGWRMFAKTWDVDEKSPLVVVKRISSIYTDWNKVLKKDAKDYPLPEQQTKIIETPEAPKKDNTPLRDANGKFISKSKKLAVESQSQTKKSFWDVLK